MLANERQTMICNLIKQNGAVTTAHLTEHLSVSLETVRRDLLVLEKNGLLTRVHGGAVAKNDMKPFLKLNERNNENSSEKDELSQKAMEFINENDIIAVDSGSTAIAFAEALKNNFSKLTIVTHSYDVFELLHNCNDFSVILCGGNFMREENSFYGELTLNMLDSLHVCKSFIFISAISIKYGIFDYQNELYQIQKKLIDIADDVFILPDSSKFEKTGLLKISDIEKEYTYITDSKLKDDVLNLYRENDINIHIAGKLK